MSAMLFRSYWDKQDSFHLQIKADDSFAIGSFRSNKDTSIPAIIGLKTAGLWL